MTSTPRRRASGSTGSADSGFEATQAAITVLGDRANLLIVREAFRRTRRYQEFKERLGVSDAVLANRLHDLVAVGVLRTVQYLEHPPRYEYRLTECGIDFWRTLIGVWMWERQWGAPRRYGRLPELTHLDCGKVTTAEFGCGRCATAAVSANDIVIDVGAAVEQVGRAPLLRYRRASWKPARSIDLYSEIDSLLGDRWILGTLSAAMLGIERFGQFQRALNISPPLLSQRLGILVERGVLDRVAAGGGALPRYRLTEKGLALMPIVVSNYAWANRWFRTGGSPPVPIIHRQCGDEFVPAWFCAHCGKPMDRSSMAFDIYPPSTPSRT